MLRYTPDCAAIKRQKLATLRQRTFPGRGHVVTEVVEVFGTDDRGVERGLGEGKAYHELDTAHAVEQFVQPRLVPAAAQLVARQHVVTLVPIGRCATGDAVAFAGGCVGLQDRHLPHRMLSPATAGMRAGLAALVAGEAQAAGALPPAELRAILGYSDYDTQAKRFIVPG